MSELPSTRSTTTRPRHGNISVNAQHDHAGPWFSQSSDPQPLIPSCLIPSSYLGNSTLHREQTPLERAQEQWRSMFLTPSSEVIPSSRPTSLNTTNLRNNDPWGDLIQDKQADTTRIYVTNVNGMQLDVRGGKFDTICRTIRDIKADVFCAQEHNVDTTQSSLRKILFDTAHQHWERHRLVLGTSPIPFKTPFKPGGTLLLTVESLTGRICKQIRDKWGRWSGQEYMCQGGRKLVILSAYQPIVKGDCKGKITVAAQHTSLLLASQDKTTNPRAAFRRDLSACLHGYKQQNYGILLVGDFNEVLGSDPDGMERIVERFELLDLMAARHSSAPPATYARGSKRLDYALASQSVLRALQLCGYDAFNTRIATDHRGYFLDFKTQDLFGSDTQQLTSRAHRMLSSSNHTQVTAYIRRKYEILDKCDAFDRARKLLDPGRRHHYAERLDKDLTAASLTAEKDLPVFRDPAWSQELIDARNIVTILTKQLSLIKNGFPATEAQRQSWTTSLKPTLLPITQASCSKLLRDAKQRVKDIVSESIQRRDDELARKLQQLDMSTAIADRDTAKKLRKIRKAEDIKNLFKKLKYVRTTRERKGVTRLEIPSDPNVDPKLCTSWKQVDVPTDILELLQTRNRIHFGQAHGSPFTIPPLSTQLGFDANTKSGEQILSGNYDCSPLDPYVKLLIRYLHRLHCIAESLNHSTISEDEFKEKLKVWSESTTTSPSGLHLGHYKTLIARHSFLADTADEDLTVEFKQQRDELNFKQTALLNLHLDMINYALRTGYSYRRWQTIANTILFKDKDNVRLHRTRVIHIYEADFNLALGVKWRSAMHHAEDNDLLNEGQYGSRPRRCATDPVLIEELQCEISRATRKPVVLTNYDATACYDRIIPNLGMLASQKYGVAPSVTTMNAATLHKAEYKVRTELGLAPTGYSHQPDFPIYGTGQGSANSPAIWCFLSSTLFDCYDQVVRPACYASPTGNTAVSLGMLGFVDDCNGQSNLFNADGSTATVNKIVENTRKNAQHWNNLLAASGGALELSKCSCHILQWVFTSSGAPLLVPRHTTLQSELKVSDRTTKEDHTLQLLSAYDAHKTLGHYKAPAGMEHEQFIQLKKKSDDLTKFLWACPLTRQEAWTFYYACYLPSVGYPLSCSSLSRRQLDTIQRKAMSIMVARCGYNRNTKKAILYGPLELGGANFRPLYIQQGVGQAMAFIKHWRLNSTAGKLLHIALDWFQMQAGVSYVILEKVTPVLPHLESKWIASLRQFLAEHDMHFQLRGVTLSKPQRKYDALLMDVILDSKRFTPREIRCLKYCRLFLAAQTVSDISLLDGKTLDSLKLQGIFSPTSSCPRGFQIYQQRPSEAEWSLWRRMCRMLLCHPDDTLFESLEEWIVPSQDQRNQHMAYLDQDYCLQEDTILWVRIGDEYVKCSPTEGYWTFQETSQSMPWSDLPTNLHPAEVHSICPTQWKLRYVTDTIRPPSAMEPSVFEHYVASLPEWEAELLHHLQFDSDPYTASHYLSYGLRAVSDGSVWDDNQGAFGWTLSTADGARMSQGMGPARGAKVDSYRAEAYGMLAILCLLSRLATFTNQNSPWHGILATDSQSLLEALTVPIDPSHPHELYSNIKSVQDLEVTCPEWDLLSSILTELQKWPEIRLQHVRGHQDRTTDYERLPLLAQLNVDADAMATVYQCDHGESRPLALLTDTAGVHLAGPTGSITSNYEAAIRHQATYPDLMAHLKARNGWSDRTAKLINWKAHGTSLRKQIQRKSHYTKLVNGVLPTCKHVHRNDPIRNRCPLCKTHLEDWSHILKCQHPDREEWRVATLDKWATKSETMKTRPALKRLLNDAIAGWLTHASNDFTIDPTAYPTDVHRLIHAQNAIGWHHLFLGRFATDWSEIQDIYYIRFNQEARDKKIKRTGQRWQVTLIGFLWEQWWAVWERRNRDLHGADAKSRAQAETRETHRTLRDLYDLRSRTDPHVQNLFHIDINEHLAQPTWHTKNWIAVHGSLIRDNVRKASERAKAGMRSIRDYLVAKR